MSPLMLQKPTVFLLQNEKYYKVALRLSCRRPIGPNCYRLNAPAEGDKEGLLLLLLHAVLLGKDSEQQGQKVG